MAVPEPELHAAAAKGDVDTIERLKDAGHPVREQDEGGFTALHIAVRNGQLAAARKLLDMGASIDDNDNAEFITPIQLAYLEGDDNMIQLLWERSPDTVDCAASPQGWQAGSTESPSPNQDVVPRNAHRLETGQDNAFEWSWNGSHLSANHWEYFRLGLSGTVGTLSVKLRTNQNKNVKGGAQVYLRLGRKPSSHVFDARSVAPDAEGTHKIMVDAPKSGEWVIGVTMGSEGKHTASMSISAETDSEEPIPEWVIETFAQVDDGEVGYVDTAELCQFLLFMHPSMKAEELDASFACVSNPRRLDLHEFYVWVQKNRSLVGGEASQDSTDNSAMATPRGVGSPFHKTGVSDDMWTISPGNPSTPQGQTAGGGKDPFSSPTPSAMGAIGRQTMDLPCMSITDHVLTPVSTKTMVSPPVEQDISAVEAKTMIAQLEEQVRLLQAKLDAKV